MILPALCAVRPAPLTQPALLLDPASLPLTARRLLADGRMFWASRLPSTAWAQVGRGEHVLLIRAARQQEPWQQATEAGQVLENRLSHPIAPRLVVAWGQVPAGQPDTRPVAVLLPHELHTLVRY